MFERLAAKEAEYGEPRIGSSGWLSRTMFQHGSRQGRLGHREREPSLEHVLAADGAHELRPGCMPCADRCVGRFLSRVTGHRIAAIPPSHGPGRCNVSLDTADRECPTTREGGRSGDSGRSSTSPLIHSKRQRLGCRDCQGDELPIDDLRWGGLENLLSMIQEHVMRVIPTCRRACPRTVTMFGGMGPGRTTR